MTEPARSKRRRTLRALRRARRTFWKLLVWFVIASAVLVSIGRLLAPYADSFRPFLERYLASQLDQPVRIERIEASWPRLSPRIDLRGLRIGPAEQRLLSVDRARLEIRLYNLVRPGRNSFELAALGVEMVLSQDADGRWSWRVDQGGNLAADWQRGLSAGDLVLRESGIRIAPRDLPPLDWSVPEAHLTRTGDRVGIRLRAESADGNDASLDVRLTGFTSEAGLESLRGHARTADLSLPVLGDVLPFPSAPDSRFRAEAWMEWRRGSAARVHALVEMAEPGPADVPASRMTLDAIWRGSVFRAEINARETGSDATPLVDGLAFGRSGPYRAVAADHVDLAWLHTALDSWLGARTGWPERLSGTARALRLGIGPANSVHAASGRVEALYIGLDGMSLTGVDVDIGLAGDRLLLRPSGSAVVEVPALYAEPLEFESVSGALTLEAGRIGFRGFRFSHPAVAATVDGTVVLPGDGPFVDLVIDAPRLTPEDPRRWLPRRGIPAKTRNWLDDALIGVERGRAVTTLFGKPRAWPRHAPPGSINSLISFTGLRLAYARGWPVAEDIDGTVEFSGESMRGAAERGRVAGVELRAPRVRIAEARNAEIELTLETRDGASAGGLAELASALPLEAARMAMDAMSWAGPAGARAEVWFPVRHRRDWRLLGTVEFGGSSMRLPEIGLGVNALRGALPFTRDRIGPAELDATVSGEPVRLRLDSSLGPPFRFTLQGDFPVVGIVPRSWRASNPDLFEHLTGTADYRAEFAAEPDGSFGMTLTSDLEGVESTLPAPLDKRANESWPLRLYLPLDEALVPTNFSLADLVSGTWLATGDYWQLGLALGGAEAGLPAAENFVVEGRVPQFEVDAWAALLGGALGTVADGTAGRGQGRTGWLDIDVGELIVGKRSMGAVDAVLNREGEYWRLSASGERLDGAVRFPATPAADPSVIADLQRVHWPAAKREAGDGPPAPSRASPVAMPPVDVVIRELRWGDLDLGEFRVNSHRDEAGLQIEQVSSRRDGLELSGSGAWIADASQPFSRMRLRFSTRDLGATLTRAGFDIALQDGRAVIELDGRWPGSPLDLSLPRFEGDIELVVTEGVIPEASPGAGRILGLVSLNSIPRRLRLDFSDVFGEGLSFDRVAGRFVLADGVASTEDLRIDAPAAEIRMRGRTDLEARTYDQTLVVRPGVSSALPIIGALAGGPVGAAAGAALQQIFSGPIQGISEIRYSVTGDWDDPVIQPVEVRTGPADGNG